MADEPKKLFDVARPGKSFAGSSSRPVIVTNRPVVEDPMMVKHDQPEYLTNRHEPLDIQPIHDDVKPDFDVAESDAEKKPAEKKADADSLAKTNEEVAQFTEDKTYFVHIKGVKRRKRVRTTVALLVGIIIMSAIGYFAGTLLAK